MLERASSELEAANLALGHCKVPAATSFDEVPRGTTCRQVFGTVRDQLLAETWWNFATRHEVLAERIASQGDPLVDRFPYKFPLPADCVEVRYIEGAPRGSWQLEAPKNTESEAENYLAYKSSTPPRICYTGREGVVLRWSAGFLQIFAHRLAEAINPLLGKDNGLTEFNAAQAARLLDPIKKRNAREKSRQSIPAGGSWLASRSGYRSG